MTATAETSSRVLVLGVGNLLMRDEGIGVHVVRELEREEWPERITVLDGGTGGFHLLSYLCEHGRIVMVDATMDGEPPGTIRVLRPRSLTDMPRTLSAHDIGLRDLLESAALLGAKPEVVLVTVSVAEISGEGVPLSTELSPSVLRVLPEAAALVRGLAREAGRQASA
ncbi:MAG: HyaD/HybD family hydrogenase maturation endopeptidase [Thermoanaerobaculia bacterium]|nr:HyaD/HybD family hydrogenase maturation endopeptidase [Thermoanaerobaculia bacterium]